MQNLTRIPVLALLSIMLAGCSTTTNPRFYALGEYTLSAGNPSRDPAAGGKALYSVAVGPVTLPEFVDRPQLVVRIGANEVEIAEMHRWAEPLDSEIPRVIAADLERQLPGARVMTLEQSGAIDADYRVAVDVQRFDSVLGEAATVNADWTVYRASGGKPAAGQTLVREPAGGDGYNALVAAHRRALERISRDIAMAVRTATATIN